MIMDLAFTFQMPLYKILNEMTYEEMLMWFKYLEHRPIGWREDLRLHKILQSLGTNEPAHKLFQSIAQMKQAEQGLDMPEREGALDPETFLKSDMFNRILKAKQGEVLPIS